ncbi:hypothetical protein [Tistlia consotensis]|uniref:hypothetical protein n=1 Tax=Tistlia consotensis TaxID=1321365 RepID=UPI000A14EF75|nr:hypothetical protein [Tistlia consotensis]
MSSLCACSAITQGTTQEIYVNTTPPDANCALQREGKVIARVEGTPSAALVAKTKHDIIITCEKDGYETATYYNKSGWESGSGAAGIALDVVFTAGLSSIIDSATGADNKYESPVNITMVPKQTAPKESASKQ